MAVDAEGLEEPQSLMADASWVVKDHSYTRTSFAAQLAT
jgi:hypothetical protein